MTEAEVTASATAALKPAFPNVPAPTGLLRSAWSLDPFSLGSYSFVRVGSSPGDRDALAAPEGRRFFAGEACSRDHAATVHGAYASGEAAAKAILR
ncbi:MAG: FAD-dependent oxidoreductase, partial [Mycobacterium sp.]